MFASIAVLFVLPWLDSSPIRSGRFRPYFKWFFWIFVIDCLVLGYIGAMPAESPYTEIGQVATAWYFLHFLVILPLLSRLERPMPLPASISEPVLGGAGMAAAPARSPEGASGVSTEQSPETMR